MTLFFFVLTLLSSQTSWADDDSLRKIQMPILKDSVLRISGPIDSHIYDAIAYMTSDLPKGTYVELNSYGGSSYWALQIAKKLRELEVNTVVPSENVCASACVYLFSAGIERLASPDVWFGIHGARLGQGFVLEFQNHCFQQNSAGEWSFDQNLSDCDTYIDKWYQIAMASTLDSFAFMEANGISIQLRLNYLSQEIDPGWPWQGNIIKIKDWKLKAEDALRYNLVTELLAIKTFL